MKQKELKTISIKLNSIDTEEYLQLLHDSSILFNHYTSFAYEVKSYNKNKCHQETYQDVTKKFPNIKTALIQSVRDNALESVKRGKFKCKQPIKRPTSGLRLDKRSVSLRGKQISIIGMNQRHKEILHIPKVHQQVFENWDFKMGTLTYQKKNNQFWINLVFQNPNPILTKAIKSTNEVVGIDRGLYHTAVTSDGTFYSANKIRAKRRQFLHVKKTLQQKGTQSAKRKLKKLSGKEKRFMKDVNHCITKELANSQYNMFVLEKLTGITHKRKGRKLNKWMSNWSFYQFETFLTYKAEALGKQVVYIDPRYTSQKCSKCNNRTNTQRTKSKFKCNTCGYTNHADINAAINIKQDYTLSITQIESMEQAANNSKLELLRQPAKCKEATHLQAPRSLV